MGWKNHTGLLIFAAAIGAAPWVFPDSYYRMIEVGHYALICIGLSLLLGYAGQISLGHAAFYAVGAYASAVLTTRCEWSPYAAIWAGIALSITIALLVGLPSLRLRGHYLAMATLAFGMIVHVILTAWVPVTGGPDGFGHIPYWSAFGHSLKAFGTDLQAFFLIWTVVFLGLLVALHIIHSRVGRALRSIHDGEEAANVLGVATNSFKIKVFVLSAVYASVSGSLYVHIGGYINTGPFGIEHSILFLVMVIAGGMRTVWGAMVGACLMGLMPELLSELEQWRFVIYGLVLLVIMVFVPQGILLGARDAAVWATRLALRRSNPTRN